MSDDIEIRDSNGTVLQDGDNIVVIKDLKVKGSNSGLKRGTLIKAVRINPYGGDECVECRTGSFKGISIRQEYVKKA